MTDQLHYPGDQRGFDPDHILGPDVFGAHYRPAAADYDPATDVTTLTLVPIPPAELTERAQKRFTELLAVAATTISVRALFQEPTEI